MRNTLRNQFITCISLKQLVYGLLLEKSSGKLQKRRSAGVCAHTYLNLSVEKKTTRMYSF